MKRGITQKSTPRVDSGLLALALLAALSLLGSPGAGAVDYPVVDTGQSLCYDDVGAEISCPTEGQSFHGQDAQYTGNLPSYTDNGDGTITDDVTGLMWQQDPGEKQSHEDAIAGVESFSLAGYDDWRVPTIKELYSLIDFRGVDVSGFTGDDTSGLTPFIDADHFVFSYGDTSSGERVIDSQWVTSTVYESTVMGVEECFFGVNFADGRIKCYPTREGMNSGYYAIYVRGSSYGENSFADNGDGTVADDATGLMWSQDDSGTGLNWEEALDWVDQMNATEYLGHTDWRLPNAKELQSIVDYSRSPDTTGSAAIDPLFVTTAITNEAGRTDYPSYWSSTTHTSTSSSPGTAGVYVAFGRAMGYFNGSWVDVHGAGAQRSDPKAGDPADYPEGRGPQGDAIRIYNYVRLVRTAEVSLHGCAELGGEPVVDRRVVLKQTGESKLRVETGDDGCFSLGPVVSGKSLKLRLYGPSVESAQDDLAVCFMKRESPLGGNGKLILKQSGETTRRQWTDDTGCGLFEDLAAEETFKLFLKVKNP